MSGTVTLRGGQWHVEAEPHVLLRLKRIFGQAGKRAGSIKLSDTEEIARDLEWAVERYPLSIDPLPYLKERAAAYRERQTLVDGFLSRRVAPPPFDLAIPPREYQRIAAAIALSNRGLLLADDLGLGKTASAICMLSDARTLPALVVTMTHLPRQWEAELARFAPKLRVHILKKGTPYDLTKLGGRGRQLGLSGAFPDVIVCNYHKLAGWADTLAPIIRAVVFDEAQELRSGVGARETPAKYEAAKLLADAATYRLGLTATPIYNYGGEFYSVLNVLSPGSLGSWSEFQNEWCVGTYGDKPKLNDAKVFGSYLREAGLMLRRTRAEVGRELPELTKVPHYVDANQDALDSVSASCAELARVILAQGEAHRGAKMHASEELSNVLRQATGIAKAPYVAEFVKLLVESGEKVVLFGWHRAVYDIWLDRLKDYAPVLYTGSETAAQKEQAKTAFVDGDAKILIMSLRSGAGLDGLQKVCHVGVFGELDWSPGVHEQCVGRFHRDGQTEPAVAYYLMAESGADPIISDVLGLKREQVEGVRNPNDDLIDRLEVDGSHIRRLAESYVARAVA